MGDQGRVEKRADTSKPARKRYNTPKLEEYGHVAKLTQSGGSTMTESGNPNMKACL